MSAPKFQPDAASHIRSFVERIERLDEEIKELNTDKRDVYAEVKGYGLDVKALRAVVSLRRKDAAGLQEHNAIVALYLSALGMQINLPDASRVHVHVREELSEHDQETGEITEEPDTTSGVTGGERPAPHSNICSIPGTRVNHATGVVELEDDLPAVLRRSA